MEREAPAPHRQSRVVPEDSDSSDEYPATVNTKKTRHGSVVRTTSHHDRVMESSQKNKEEAVEKEVEGPEAPQSLEEALSQLEEVRWQLALALQQVQMVEFQRDAFREEVGRLGQENERLRQERETADEWGSVLVT